MLFASAAFMACSHDTDFESVAEDNVKNQYIAAFEKKYGKVDPNQSWDFTSHAGVLTRSEPTPAMTWNIGYYGSLNSTDENGMKYKEMQDAVKADYTKVKDLVYSSPEIPFDYTYCQAHLYPAFSHGYIDLNDINYDYFYLGAEYTYNGQNSENGFPGLFLQMRTNNLYNTSY